MEWISVSHDATVWIAKLMLTWTLNLFIIGFLKVLWACGVLWISFCTLLFRPHCEGGARLGTAIFRSLIILPITLLAKADIGFWARTCLGISDHLALLLILFTLGRIKILTPWRKALLLNAIGRRTGPSRWLLLIWHYLTYRSLLIDLILIHFIKDFIIKLILNQKRESYVY